jgi:hypothetical protein
MYPKLVPFQPAIVTAAYFPSYLNTPEKLNEGRCWQWAYLAHKTFKDVELWDICDHAFVRYRNKFYDSERLFFGEMDWRDLPAASTGWSDYLVCPECEAGNREPGAAHLLEWQFKNHWTYQTRRYNTTWEELDRLAQKELARHVRR